MILFLIPEDKLPKDQVKPLTKKQIRDFKKAFKTQKGESV